MRRWQHEVSAEWLKARQTVLTATDVAGLLPEYKRYLKATAKDPDEANKLWPGFSGVWCQKHSDTYLDTSAASSAAARGHVMEPWAIDSWNKQVDTTFHHWDDCIICREGIGFSPDAMTIPQLTIDAKLEVSTDFKFLIANSAIHYDCPNEIMEIKSYEPAQHMKAITEDRMEHKELMQVAMAFAVLPNLEKVRLLWFCPGAPISMFVETYVPDDLHDQCRWIAEIEEVYSKQAKLCESFTTNNNVLTAQCTEDEVYSNYISELNDENIFMLK